jgi:hypothetical protein
MTAPLTAAQEREIRKGCVAPFEGRAWTDQTIKALLATLDAARAQVAQEPRPRDEPSLSATWGVFLVKIEVPPPGWVMSARGDIMAMAADHAHLSAHAWSNDHLKYEARPLPVAPARLDTDGTAQGKTEIRAVTVVDEHGSPSVSTTPLAHLDTETGVRTPLSLTGEPARDRDAPKKQEHRLSIHRLSIETLECTVCGERPGNAAAVLAGHEEPEWKAEMCPGVP